MDDLDDFVPPAAVDNTAAADKTAAADNNAAADNTAAVDKSSTDMGSTDVDPDASTVLASGSGSNESVENAEESDQV